MATYTKELFETIILRPKDFTGQRVALAFFGAGTQGIINARRAAKRLKAEGEIADPVYLGGAEVEAATEIERQRSSKQGWRGEEAASSATQLWFHYNHASLVLTLQGELQSRLARAVIFATDKDYPARGCVRRICDWVHFACGRGTSLIAFDGDPEDQDWLAREMISSVGGALLWPTARFELGAEPLLKKEPLDFDDIDQRGLAFFLQRELAEIVRGDVA